MKLEDITLLNKVVNDIKKLPNLVGIVQMGSSLYSKEYKDIDVIIFFDRFLIPPELAEIREKYKESKLWLEGVSIKKSEKFNPGSKIFAKFFLGMKHKKILHGKDPYANKKITLKKEDVAAYIWYQYHICELYGQGYEGALSASMNAMLTYVNKSPLNKEETFNMFLEEYTQLSKHLPKNAEKFLRGATRSNFKELYDFFEFSIKYFAK